MNELVEPQTLVQLAGSGGVARVEEEWMRLVESPQATPGNLARYQPVLDELSARQKRSEAEALAWAAVETLMARSSARDVLPMAGTFLLALGECDEFRKQVTELYRTAFGDREGLDELLSEAGLAGGRPVRRALRTLDVCLAVKQGDYLVSREGDSAARIERIEVSDWNFSIKTPQKSETLGPVHLADRYEPASADDFYVLRYFDPDQLRERLENDPAAVLADLCRRNGNAIDSEQLAELLAPDLVSESDWKRWWGKARTSLKKSAHFRLEGRSPYTIVFDDKPLDHTTEFVTEFNKHRDPLVRLGLVENYTRDCATRSESPDASSITHCHSALKKQAGTAMARGDSTAALAAAVAWQVGEAADAADAQSDLFELMKNTADPAGLLAPIRREDLLERAVKALFETRPKSGRDELLTMLPTFPQAFCDRAVEWLIEGGCTRDDLDPVVQRIMGSPVAHFDALLWLWDGPAYSELIDDLPPLTIISRILRALNDARLSDAVNKEHVKSMTQHARSALSARNFERFELALQGIEGGMAQALRNQIQQVESLGRSVHDGLLNRVAPHLPKKEAAPAVASWEMEDVVFTTEAGLSRKQNEIEHHVNVKMRENAIAIGAAAEKGDLSENSEYKFALEERDLLRARLAQMNSEMQAARVFSPDDVPTDRVGIGTRVVMRRTTDGEIYGITFVGPWESDYEKNRINYKAPLARTVLGKRIGDMIEFEHSGATGTYEIIELHNGLKEMAAE